MENLKLILYVMLLNILCVTVADGSTCYAQAQLARWVSQGITEVDIEWFGRRPFEPLYKYAEVNQLRESIKIYEESLTRYNRENFPKEYGILHIRLGCCYLALRTLGRAEDVQLATEHFDEAIRVCGQSGIAKEYYEAKIGLGLALTELPEGDRVSNINQAVNMLREGVKFFNKEDAPQIYAIANNGLGFAHVHLYGLAGQRGEDADAAMDYFNETLSVTSYERFPAEYAKARLGMGILYASILDTGRENLEDMALRALWDARNVFSTKFFPTYYTEDLFLTSLIYARKGDYEKAEEFIQRAVKVADETDNPNLQKYMNYLYAIQATMNSDEY